MVGWEWDAFFVPRQGCHTPRLVHYFLDQLEDLPSWNPPAGSEEDEDVLEDLSFQNISKGENDLQLVVKLDLILPEGSTLPGVEILIDKGAEVNLIREGLVPKHLLSPAEKNIPVSNGGWDLDERRGQSCPAQDEFPKNYHDRC